MVTCMYGDDCSAVADQGWYWIYYIGPFLASFAVAEVTLWMEWDVDGESDLQQSGAVDVVDSFFCSKIGLSGQP